MLNRFVGLLKDGENLAIFLFLIYVIILVQIVAYFILAWSWTPLGNPAA
jgi:hypothetical protein